MAYEGFKRKLAEILSADVEGYSRLMDDNEEAIVRTLSSYRTAITDIKGYYNEHPIITRFPKRRMTAGRRPILPM